jgi:hypothetical protein
MGHNPAHRLLIAQSIQRLLGFAANTAAAVAPQAAAGADGHNPAAADAHSPTVAAEAEAGAAAAR